MLGWIWSQPLGSPYWVRQLPRRHGEPSNWSCSWRTHIWLAWAAGCAPWSTWTSCAGNVSVPLLSLKRQSHHPSRSNSWSGSTYPDSFASVFWNVAGTLPQPERHAFTFKECSPQQKQYIAFEASSIAISQNPAFRSKQEKYPAPTRLSIASCICGSW